MIQVPGKNDLDNMQFARTKMILLGGEGLQEVHVIVEFKQIIFYNFTLLVYLARFIQAFEEEQDRNVYFG